MVAECGGFAFRGSRHGARCRSRVPFVEFRPSCAKLTTGDNKEGLMTRRGRRLTLLVSAFSVLAVATALVLVALESTVVFFYSPSDLATLAAPPAGRIRVGGLVVENSVRRDNSGGVDFVLTDNGATLNVRFVGVLPDLFREGQGIVAEGRVANDGRFLAEQVLAKHDENYMPREVAESLKEKGEWRGETAP